MGEAKRWIPGLALALAATLVAAALTSSTAVRRTAFCAPAAHVAGILSGAPCEPSGDDYRLVGSGLDLIVVPACAAADYFCLMAGFLSLLATWRAFPVAAQALVLPAAWGLTVFFNALRLTACWQSDRLAQAFLPASVGPAAHMAVGDATFLAGLTLVFWLMARRGAGAGAGIKGVDGEGTARSVS